MKASDLFIVDAFTDRPFRGNPAAVCVRPSWPADAWMQRVASELNLSETAFVCPSPPGWGLRWFTPKMEVELCGHATLASAHILWEQGLLPAQDAALFETLSGRLVARRASDGVEMDFPALGVEDAGASADIAKALGAEPLYVGRSRFDYLVELSSESVVSSLTPDFAMLRAIEARGFIVTARADRQGFDFVSRFFAPSAGIDEDPVTGSAHCALAPYWSKKLQKNTFTALQVSKRTGVVRARLEGQRVILGGSAVTVARVELAEGI